MPEDKKPQLPLDVKIPTSQKKSNPMTTQRLVILLFFLIFVPSSCVIITDLYGPQNDNATRFHQMEKTIASLEQKVKEIEIRQSHLRRVIYITSGIRLPEVIDDKVIDDVIKNYIHEKSTEEWAD